MKVASLTFALQQNINKREKQMYAFPPLKYVPWYQKMECFIIVIDEKTNCSNIFCCELFKFTLISRSELYTKILTKTHKNVLKFWYKTGN